MRSDSHNLQAVFGVVLELVRNIRNARKPLVRKLDDVDQRVVGGVDDGGGQLDSMGTQWIRETRFLHRWIFM